MMGVPSHPDCGAGVPPALPAAGWKPAPQRHRALLALVVLASLAAAGCRKEDMGQQPRVDPMEPSGFFADGISARPLVEGTVARGQTYARDGYLIDPSKGNEFGEDFPPDFPRTGEALRLKLDRGKERFEIYCVVCHGYSGNGDGMVVRRGMVQPPSYHIDRLRQAPPGYIYNVITNGHGAMFSYAARVQPADRWAIAAYIKALQLSQGAKFDGVTLPAAAAPAATRPAAALAPAAAAAAPVETSNAASNDRTIP